MKQGIRKREFLRNSKYLIYLGSFESERLAEKFKSLLKLNGDVLALRDFKIVKEIKGTKKHAHLIGLSSLSV